MKTIFLLLNFLILIFFSSCAIFQIGSRIESLEEKIIEEGTGSGKILLIDIDGPISNRPKKTLIGFSQETGMVDRIREILKKADRDNNIRGILLRINSPGGTVTSSDIIYNEIKLFKEKKEIKVYVSVVDIATSGAYYVAMSSDRIFMHPTSLTGSIGVLAMKVNLQGLMANIGVDWEIVKSSEKKDFMSPFRSLSKEEKSLFQETIDRYYDRFITIVALNRPQLDIEKVRELADGRIYNARQALNHKLIDSIGYLNDTISLIKRELNQPNLKVVIYTRPGVYKSNFYSTINRPELINLINLDMGFDLNQLTPQFMYLWGQ